MNIDPQLLKACREHDRRAQFRLFKFCFSFLMSVCVRYTKSRDDATELLNMGFLKILMNLDKYREEVPFGLWIRRIMINAIIDEHRKYKKEKELIIYEDFDDRQNNSELLDYNDADQRFDAEELESLIAMLPPVTRQVFNLYVIDGYSHKEIGDKLGIAEGTSKWHLSFARKRLKEMMLNALKEKKTMTV